MAGNSSQALAAKAPAGASAKARKAPAPHGSVMRLLLSLALAAGSQGVCSAGLQQALGRPNNYISGLLCTLVATRRLFTSATYPWPYRGKRWFHSAAACAAYCKRHPPPARPPVVLRGTPTFGARPAGQPAPRGPAAMRHLPSPAAAAAAVAANAPLNPALHPDARYVCASMPDHSARFRPDPATRVAGGFAAMGVGRYLAATGEAPPVKRPKPQRVG